MRLRKGITVSVLLFAMLVLLCCCTARKTVVSTGINSIDDLTGKKIGVLTGSIFDKIAEKHIKNVQIEYFNDSPSLPVALGAGKIDGYVADQPITRVFIAEYPNERCLTILEDDNYGFIFPKTEKGDALRNQFNEFLTKIWADGTIKEIDSVWFGNDESLKVVNFESLSGENGTIKFAICSTMPPFAYVKDGKFVGYEVCILEKFCREYGYSAEVIDATFAGMIASVAGGKADCAASTISITEERKQSMYFSEPDYLGGIALVVSDTGNTGNNNIEANATSGSIGESFAKTFIREDRWKLFVNGIGVTVLITVLSVVLGTAIGFLLYLLYRRKYKVFNGIFDVFMNILEKTPVVVILMILYFVIFSSSNITSMWVSVIGFSIMFACTFVKTVDIGVKAIDNGQVEASLALGFTDTKTFLLVILPQAARHFIPNYRGNIVSLLKDTAIVGYIAVQDLTKVGDIVRSRTYEAFFPLIVTALIYFLLAWLLTQIVKRIEFNFDVKNRSAEKILKGVKTK